MKSAEPAVRKQQLMVRVKNPKSGRFVFTKAKARQRGQRQVDFMAHVYLTPPEVHPQKRIDF